MLRDATAGNAAGPYEGYKKTRGVVVALSSRIASGTFDAGHHNKCTMVRSMRLSTRRPLPDSFGRYLVNGSNRFVRRWRLIDDVTLVWSNFYSLFLRTSMHHLKVGQEDCV